MKNIFSVRGILAIFLLLSVIFASAATYYKIEYWGFSINPREKSDVWTIDTHISFEPTGKPIEVSLSTPKISDEYKILSEDVVAKGYEVKEDEKHLRVTMTSAPRKGKQDIYYRVMLYDNEDTIGKIHDFSQPQAMPVTFSDEQQQQAVEELWALANQKEGTNAEKIISLLNQKPMPDEVDTFLPVKRSQRIIAEKIIFLLAVKDVPARIVRGVKLKESKRETSPDLMVEVYEGSKWMIYNIETGVSGLPKDFVIFQRGGVSLLDVAGGKNSEIKFSVTKSVISSSACEKRINPNVMKPLGSI